MRLAALGVAAACLFLGSWALLHQVWYRSAGEIVDTPGYETHADAIAVGQVPYRDFSFEYPPGALVPMLAPELTARRGNFGDYGHSFEKWMAGAGVLMTLLAALALAALRPPPLRAAVTMLLVGASPLLLGNLMLSRFDLWVAALTVGALAALLWERDTTSAVVLGAAIATKLFPAVLVHLVANGEQSGALAPMLERAAAELEREAERRLTWVAALIQPALIVLMGAIVLVLVLAVMLPIVTMNQLIR